MYCSVCSQSLTVGLVTHQPDDHFAYLQQCLDKAKSMQDAPADRRILDELHLGMSDQASGEPQRRLFATQPLPPIQPNNQENVAQPLSGRSKACSPAPVVSGGLCLHKAPLPPIGPKVEEEADDGTELVKAGTRQFMQEKVVFVLGWLMHH